MTEINVGDTARLKAGGPLMTVARMMGPVSLHKHGRGNVECKWFDAEDKLHSGVFEIRMLKVGG